MSNDHVATPFRQILESIVRPVPQPEPKPLTNRDRFRVLEAIYEELVAVGVQIDIGQLDWAIKEYEHRVVELDGQRQYYYELWRKAKDADEFIKSAPSVKDYHRGER